MRAVAGTVRSLQGEVQMKIVSSQGLARLRVAGAGLALALVSLVGIAAPAARADTVDAVDGKFLAALKSKGINFESPQVAIISAHEVCDQIDLGRQTSDVAAEVTKNSNLDSYKAGYFVGVSVAAFCPRHSS
jgi:Protein of unknown function (DUF732)